VLSFYGELDPQCQQSPVTQGIMQGGQHQDTLYVKANSKVSGDIITASAPGYANDLSNATVTIYNTPTQYRFNWSSQGAPCGSIDNAIYLVDAQGNPAVTAQQYTFTVTPQGENPVTYTINSGVGYGIGIGLTYDSINQGHWTVQGPAGLTLEAGSSNTWTSEAPVNCGD
jgi:hypothetical protein